MSKKPKRILVVGDINGGLKALRQCLISSKYDQHRDRLVFLGNYVGNLPDSAGVIETLIWLEHTSVHKPIFLRGNNDKWCGMWLNNGGTNRYWLDNTGRETVVSYLKNGYYTKDSHRKFFDRLFNYYIDLDNKAFVHSGYESEKGLGFEENAGRYYFNRSFWNGTLYNTSPFIISKMGAVKKYRSEKYNEVFIGHQPTINNIYSDITPETKLFKGEKGKPIDLPMQRRNIHNINTGAAQGYSLTIMDAHTKQWWQSAPTRNLYKELKQ